MRDPRPTFTRNPLGGFMMSCPKFPEEWTSHIAKKAYQHAQDVYPHEAAGIANDNGEYIPLENMSDMPDKDVSLNDADLLKVAEATVFFHSHPDGPACPSFTDMVYQQQLEIPFVILPLPLGDPFVFAAEGLEKAPLIGRAFRHGVHDCYSLIRDRYLEKGIYFPDQPRGWEWWNKGMDYYNMKNFTDYGMRVIDKDKARQEDDILLFQFGFSVIMHGAIVCKDPNLIMHHTSGSKPFDTTRVSSMVPRLRWQRHVKLALRHESNVT